MRGENVELHTVIEPVPELVETMLNQVFCSSEIKPWIDYIGALLSVTVGFAGEGYCWTDLHIVQKGNRTFVDDTFKS